MSATVGSEVREASLSFARRFAIEWLWFVGTALSTAVVLALLALGSREDAADAFLPGLVRGAFVAYPLIAAARVTRWAWRTVRPRPSPEASRSRSSLFEALAGAPYVLGGCLFALATGMFRGLAGPELLGRAMGLFLLWGIVVGVVKYFRPAVSWPRWVFWGLFASMLLARI
jgi:hypothetical protein